MSPIHTFPVEDIYTPKFLDSFQRTIREDSPVEVAAPPLNMKSKPTRGRQNRMIQSEDAPRQVAWTNAEEIPLCKCWVYVSENNILGNTRKDVGFWTEVLLVHGSKTQQLQESRSSDEDYFNRALVDYEAETGTTFKLRHCWEILKSSPKWMQSEVSKITAKSGGGNKRYKLSGSSSFNTESREVSINLNVDVDDDEEDEVQEIQRPVDRDKLKMLRRRNDREHRNRQL
ncbi:ALP1-like protein [Tanacetum coccineum]